MLCSQFAFQDRLFALKHVSSSIGSRVLILLHCRSWVEMKMRKTWRRKFVTESFSYWALGKLNSVGRSDNLFPGSFTANTSHTSYSFSIVCSLSWSSFPSIFILNFSLTFPSARILWCRISGIKCYKRWSVTFNLRPRYYLATKINLLGQK